MSWTETNYPDSMKDLTAEVRNKAIKIANTLMEKGGIEESTAIATAISRAKGWAARHWKKTERNGKK